MVSNSVREAVEAYERTVKEATMKYEQALRDAEMQLRAVMSTPATSAEPPQNGTVQISKEVYTQYQQLLPVIEKLSKMRPEQLESIGL